MKSPIVRGNAASSDMVNGSMPSSSSSLATRIAKPSESKPVSCRDRSSSSGGSVTFCSAATCCIAEIIFNLIDMDRSIFHQIEKAHDSAHIWKVTSPVADLLAPLVNPRLQPS